MATGGGAFSAEEMRYLMNLPAVANVTRSRITYAEAFRRSCLRRYINGESPVKLFREAGLDPSLVGYKRIARCFARWKAQAVKNGELTEDGMTLRWDASGDEASCETTPSPCFPSDTSVALRCGANATVGGVPACRPRTATMYATSSSRSRRVASTSSSMNSPMPGMGCMKGLQSTPTGPCFRRRLVSRAGKTACNAGSLY